MIIRNKITFLIIFLITMNYFVHAKKLADLPELTKFFYITVGKNNIYISDGKAYKVRVYSKKDYKYLNSFGKHGEGPGEFISYPGRVYIKGEKLLLLNNREVYFTLDGKLIKERTMKIRAVKPVSDSFVGIMFETKRELTRFGHPYMSINTYNNKLKKTKTIYRVIKKNMKMKRVNEIECFSSRQDFDVTDDKIVISDPQKGFYFKILDSKGVELYEINVPYKKKKVTNMIKDDEIKAMAKSYGKSWKTYKNNLVFPDYVPAYLRAKVFDNKIYAFTFNTKDDHIELITVDLKGKVLGKTFVPRASQNMCTVKDGIYYYIHEGENVWELHAIKIH